MNNSLSFAQELDKKDKVQSFREQFFIPKKNNEELIYFCGNSLGLQSKNTRKYLEIELKKWEEEAVEGHFRGEGQWYDFHKQLKKPYINIVGGNASEVTLMNNLTTNLHILLTTFYQPNPQKFKILIEEGAFPSDYYALESQIKLKGFSPEEALIELVPRNGEYTLRTEDILQVIENEKDTLALVMMGGINYYTGQVFDMQKITEKAHQIGALAGFDLAHVAGNVPLKLHEWEVDFAAWCTYKYLNSSPGGVSGIFIHEKHAKNTALPRLAGWWGYDEETRFEMKKGFQAIPTVDGWQLSNAPILLLATHKASLEIFEKAGMENLRQKSIQLTNFLEFVVREAQKNTSYPLQILTPKNSEERGCQLSLLVPQQGRFIFDFLIERGVIGDWREPDVIRIAPTPLYNTFEEVYLFGNILKEAFSKVKSLASSEVQ